MDTVSRFDLASFVAVMNMLKYNSMDKPELYRTLLAVLCDYDSDDQQSKERTHRYIKLLVTDTVLAEYLICYLPNNEDPLFLGKPRLPTKSHSKKSKHRRNEARRHREANNVRQKRVEHNKPISHSHKASPILSLPAAKDASPTQSLNAVKQALPTQSLSAPKCTSPTKSLSAAKCTSPSKSLSAAKCTSPSWLIPAAKCAASTQSLPVAKHASPTQLMPEAKHASPSKSLNATKQQQQQQRHQHKETTNEERIKAKIFWPAEGSYLHKPLPSSKIEKTNNQAGEGKHLLKLLSSNKTDVSSERPVASSTDYESKGHSSATSVATEAPSLPVSSTSTLIVPSGYIKTVFDDNPFLGGQPVLSQFRGTNPSFTVPSHNHLFPSLFPACPFPFIRQMTSGFFPPGFPTFFPVTAPQLITFQGMSNFRSDGSTVVGNTTETSFPLINPDLRVTEGKQANKVSDMVISANRNSTQTTIASKKNTQCRTEMATLTKDEMMISSASEKKDQDDFEDESPGPTKKFKLEEQSQTDLMEESVSELEDSVFSVDDKYGIPGINDGRSRVVTKSLGSDTDGSGSKTGGGDGFGSEQRPVSVPLPMRNSGIKIKTDISNLSSLVAQTLTARNVISKEGEAKMNLDTSSQTFSYEFKPSVDHKARKTAGVKKNRNITGNVHSESTSVVMSDVAQGIHTSKTETVDKNKPKGFILGHMHGQDKMTSFSVNPTSMDFLLQKPGVRFVASKSLHNTLLLNSKNQSSCDKRDKSDTWSSLNAGAKQSSVCVETVQSSASVKTQQSSSSLDATESLKSLIESKDLTDSLCFQPQNKAVMKEPNLGCDLRSNSRLASVETFQSCQNFSSHNLSTFPYSQKITLPDGKASTMIFHGEQRDRRSIETGHKFMQNSRKSSSASLNQTISEVAKMMRIQKDMQNELVKPLPKSAATSVVHNDTPAAPGKPGRVSPTVTSQMEAKKKVRQKVSLFSLKKKPMITTLVSNKEMFSERNTAHKLKSPPVNVSSPSNEESRQLQASPNEFNTELAKFTF
ncbi:hypothetical protein CHS0354_010493 [Potamilus streckersoni]|uniref:Uncharacterized protein n=1 Tax=Potamilus streckersoni TaxID=2493646 RepID=A0AAE0RRL9_9BIVA|nr:hypothetical protein CHS0354_010493 [Potamilus streckersoni]